MLIDSHAHLNDNRFDNDLDDVINNLKNNGVDLVVCCSNDIQTSEKTLEIAEKYQNVYAIIGVHPHDAKIYDKSSEDFLCNKSQHNKVVALGEIGLDFYYDLSDRDTQRQVFIKQIILADKLNLPVIFHVRDAIGEFIDIIRAHKQYFNNGGIIHSFSGSVEVANILINEFGFLLSFNGIITFKNARKTIEVLSQVDIKNIVLETDCPYLTPEPYRGRRNEPKYVSYVCKKVAEIKNMRVSEVEDITSNNVLNLFKKIKVNND